MFGKSMVTGSGNLLSPARGSYLKGPDNRCLSRDQACHLS